MKIHRKASILLVATAMLMVLSNNPVNGKWGYINAEGQMAIEPQYDEATLFS